MAGVDAGVSSAIWPTVGWTSTDGDVTGEATSAAAGAAGSGMLIGTDALRISSDMKSLTGLPDKAATAAFAAARRSAGVALSSTGLLAAAYETSAPSGMRPSARAACSPWIVTWG